ncbi:MAG TPA: helix-turn-helix transcriptional regulator [Actinocrinis sp.]|nr:helix-turn-helix transcriptional regulator [Actinocrinis sp.]
MDRIDRPEFAGFLRRCRERLEPAAAGLAPRARTRTPGLRREDVADLAGISVDYYTRLEQARGPHPSVQVLGALARAFRLTGDERDHLYRLAGQQPPGRYSVSEHVRPGLLLILDRLYDAPAQVATDYGQVLVRNAMAEALFGGRAQPGRAGNIVWNYFTEPAAPARVVEEDRDRLAGAHVANLRAVHAARPDDPRVRSLVGDLLDRSPEFAALWERHDVAVMRSDRKTFVHPAVGRIEFECEHLLADSGVQRLILYTARPGTESHEKLALLRVLGQETFASENASTDTSAGHNTAARKSTADKTTADPVDGGAVS